MKQHPRNKSDAEIKFIVDHGGFVGVTMFPPFLPKGNSSTVEDYVATIDYVIKVAGEDAVGIGTDFTQDQDQRFFDWLTHDKDMRANSSILSQSKILKASEPLGIFPT